MPDAAGLERFVQGGGDVSTIPDDVWTSAGLDVAMKSKLDAFRRGGGDTKTFHLPKSGVKTAPQRSAEDQAAIDYANLLRGVPKDMKVQKKRPKSLLDEVPSGEDILSLAPEDPEQYVGRTVGAGLRAPVETIAGGVKDLFTAETFGERLRGGLFALGTANPLGAAFVGSMGAYSQARQEAEKAGIKPGDQPGELDLVNKPFEWAGDVGGFVGRNAAWDQSSEGRALGERSGRATGEAVLVGAVERLAAKGGEAYKARSEPGRTDFGELAKRFPPSQVELTQNAVPGPAPVTFSTRGRGPLGPNQYTQIDPVAIDPSPRPAPQPAPPAPEPFVSMEDVINRTQQGDVLDKSLKTTEARQQAAAKREKANRPLSYEDAELINYLRRATGQAPKGAKPTPEKAMQAVVDQPPTPQEMKVVEQARAAGITKPDPVVPPKVRPITKKAPAKVETLGEQGARMGVKVPAEAAQQPARPAFRPWLEGLLGRSFDEIDWLKTDQNSLLKSYQSQGALDPKAVVFKEAAAPKPLEGPQAASKAPEVPKVTQAPQNAAAATVERPSPVPAAAPDPAVESLRQALVARFTEAGDTTLVEQMKKASPQDLMENARMEFDPQELRDILVGPQEARGTPVVGELPGREGNVEISKKVTNAADTKQMLLDRGIPEKDVKWLQSPKTQWALKQKLVQAIRERPELAPGHPEYDAQMESLRGQKKPSLGEMSVSAQQKAAKRAYEAGVKLAVEGGGQGVGVSDIQRESGADYITASAVLRRLKAEGHLADVSAPVPETGEVKPFKQGGSLRRPGSEEGSLRIPDVWGGVKRTAAAAKQAVEDFSPLRSLENLRRYGETGNEAFQGVKKVLGIRAQKIGNLEREISLQDRGIDPDRRQFLAEQGRALLEGRTPIRDNLVRAKVEWAKKQLEDVRNYINDTAGSWITDDRVQKRIIDKLKNNKSLNPFEQEVVNKHFGQYGGLKYQMDLATVERLNAQREALPLNDPQRTALRIKTAPYEEAVKAFEDRIRYRKIQKSENFSPQLPTKEFKAKLEAGDPDAIEAMARENVGSGKEFGTRQEMLDAIKTYNERHLKPFNPGTESARRLHWPDEGVETDLFKIVEQYGRDAYRSGAEHEVFGYRDRTTGEPVNPDSGGTPQGDLARLLTQMDSKGTPRPHADQKTMKEDILYHLGRNEAEWSSGNKRASKAVATVGAINATRLYGFRPTTAIIQASQSAMTNAVAGEVIMAKAAARVATNFGHWLDVGLRSGAIREKAFKEMAGLVEADPTQQLARTASQGLQKAADVALTPMSKTDLVQRVLAVAAAEEVAPKFQKQLNSGGRAARSATEFLRSMDYTTSEIAQFKAGKFDMNTFRQRFVELTQNEVTKANRLDISRNWFGKLALQGSNFGIEQTRNSWRIAGRQMFYAKNPVPAVRLVVGHALIGYGMIKLGQKLLGPSKTTPGDNDLPGLTVESLRKGGFAGLAGDLASSGYRAVAMHDRNAIESALDNLSSSQLMDLAKYTGSSVVDLVRPPKGMTRFDILVSGIRRTFPSIDEWDKVIRHETRLKEAKKQAPGGPRYRDYRQKLTEALR